MEYTICKLKPKAPFHIGIKEGGLEETLHYIPSDTLFSAFCNIYRMIYGKEELNNLLQDFQNDPPFLLSSVFPAIRDNLLFPLPKNTNLQKYAEKLNKKLKEVAYVSENIFKKLIKSEEIEIAQEDIAQEGKAIVKDYSGKIWEVREVPRIVLDRKTSASNIYYFGEVIFLGGLHFLIDLRNKDYEKKIRATIRVLADEGIGGDRTYGKGFFEVEGFDRIKFDEIESQWYVTLSIFHPHKEELKGIEGYYEYIERGGWAYSVETKGVRKKFVRMFSEGSVFNKKIVGDLIKVGEDKHPFYRYGYAFPVPVKVVG